MDELITQALSVITTWQQAGAVAGLIILVNLLTNLFKIEAVAKRVPAAVLPWVAVALGGVGGFLLALSAGKPLAQAVVAGVLAGLGAIGGHELFKSGKAAAPKVMGVLKRTPPAAIILIGLSVGSSSLLLVGCVRGECAEPVHAGELKCVVINGIVDCTKPELQATIEAFIPIAAGYLDKLTNADGSVDWDTFADKLAASGRGDALCIFERVAANFFSLLAKASPNVPHVDVELNRSLAHEARLKRFGNYQVKTKDGVQ